MPTVFSSRRSRRVGAALAAALAVVLAAGACGDDPFAPKAENAVANTEFSVWALTGSPTNFPTVIFVPQRFAARPDPSASFDIGFDIDAMGRVQILPVSRVMTPLATQRSVGIQVPGTAYADITAAPRTGWVFDSIVTVDVGQAFIVRVQTLYCSLELRQEVYAKYVVDSIFPAERRIKIKGRVNPNCGFRSFGDGVPTF
ncbi:MAG: hypothetical protein KF709_14070 [Gemmatimonadaceae bacterium]|nr:hypothetical protein [Gemmatimonadaceae bacterium]